MSKVLNVGVIGLGFFGGRHARIYADHPAAELIAVCDADRVRVEAVANETGAQGFNDLRTLLALPELDAVSICLPDRLHEDVIANRIHKGPQSFGMLKTALLLEGRQDP